jgi:hypothetical protein
MRARNALIEAAERFGRQAGLEKKSGAWYHHSAETIAVSQFQKSQHGSQYYFNQGFWLRLLGDEHYPKESKCHIRTRLEALVPGKRHRIAFLLDLGRDIPDDLRIEEVVALLNAHILPVIERGSSLAGLQALIDDGTLASAAILGPAQRALAIRT